MSDAKGLYRKLFKALQQGTRKQETSLVGHLCATFGIPSQRDLAAAFVAAGIDPTDVFREVVTQIQPFSIMLQEIYEFLARHRSTTSGKADQFTLKFAGLRQKVIFNLDSFPKTYIDALVTGDIEQLSFNPLALDPIHGPNRFALETISDPDMFGALSGVLHDAAHEETDRYVRQNHSMLETAYEQARALITACQTHLRQDGQRFYLPATLADRVPPDLLRHLSNGVNLWGPYQFVRAWDEWRSGQLERPLFSRYGVPEAFLKESLECFRLRFDALFPTSNAKGIYWDRVVDDVILPFWRNRWRLYEIWALVFTLNQTPVGVIARPFLVPRKDDPGMFDWPIPYGAAKAPVAEFDLGGGDALQVWFQNLTLSLAGAGHIEPDIRIKAHKAPHEDRFILELKDRLDFTTASAKSVAEKYAVGSSAMRICVADYSAMKLNQGQGRLTTYRYAQAEVLLASEFHPGCPYPEVAEAIAKTLDEEVAKPGYDLLVDVSGSARDHDIPTQVRKLEAREGRPRRVFGLTTTLTLFTGSPDQLRDLECGGTDVPNALEEYFQGTHGRPASRVILLTDEDGAAQTDPEWRRRVDFRQYGATGEPVKPEH